MSRVWMNGVWQEMFKCSDHLFRALHLGDLRSFREEMANMATVMTQEPEPVEAKTPQTCQFCTHQDDLVCSHPRSPRRWLQVGAGATCDEWEQGKD